LKEQENTLMVVLGVVGVPLTARVLYEWVPGDRFATTMAVIMVVWTLFYTTWVIQWARHRPLASGRRRLEAEEATAVSGPIAPGSQHLAHTTAGIPTPAGGGEKLQCLERLHG
jgi:hypothetical protein